MILDLAARAVTAAFYLPRRLDEALGRSAIDRARQALEEIEARREPIGLPPEAGVRLRPGAA